MRIVAGGLLLHHVNPRPYAALATQERIQELQWELLEHPPYSPDLAPSDFHLLGPLKHQLSGKRFVDNKDVKIEVRKWLRQQSKHFYAAGFDALVK
jgi:histone-lysine N-methyltransferase SETMAR